MVFMNTRQITNKGIRCIYDNYNPSVDSLEESNAIIDVIDDWNGLDVLEVGCGEGRLSALLGWHGANVIGIDYNEKSIAKAAKLRTPNVSYYVGDANGITDRFDVVVMQGVLEHLDEPYKFLRKLLTENTNCVITSSPGFLNPRGIIWMTIQMLFDIKMSLADLHEIHPMDMKDFCRDYGYELKMTSSNFDWACGDGCIEDFRKRFNSPTFPYKFEEKNIEGFLGWLKWLLDNSNVKCLGANIIYKITK